VRVLQLLPLLAEAESWPGLLCGIWPGDATAIGFDGGSGKEIAGASKTLLIGSYDIALGT
jgi:hypothetical protein